MKPRLFKNLAVARRLIAIDEVKKARRVAAIPETDYFRQLQERARKLRSRER